MGPEGSCLLAAAWAGFPWMECAPSIRKLRLCGWSAAGVGLAIATSAPNPAWWILWIGLIWFLEMEYKEAREGLRDFAEAPAVDLRRKIKTLEDMSRTIRDQTGHLQTRVSLCVGRYLAMKDFHRSLRIEELAQAVIDKMLKLTRAKEAAIGIWDKNGTSMLSIGHPSDRVGEVLERGAWKNEMDIEDVRIRIAAGRSDDAAGLGESLNELILPLPTLWRRSILYARVEEMAIVDRLTGLYVHRLFAERLRQEISRAAAAPAKSPLSLVMVDVDHFKRFNDTFGHLLGDRVLKAIGQTFISEVRKSDFAARYGGEEMAVILPETPLSGALLKAERLRKAIEKIRIPHRDQMLSVTASFGVAELSKSDISPDVFIQRADQALYRAKEAGRNRVEISETA